MSRFQIKRVYEDSQESDGTRVLVDRLWPRGVSKADADLDEWRKDVAPSNELRKWFAQDPEKFSEFARLYREELSESGSGKKFAEDHKSDSMVTLLYAAKDARCNHACVLKDELEQLSSEKP